MKRRHALVLVTCLLLFFYCVGQEDYDRLRPLSYPQTVSLSLSLDIVVSARCEADSKLQGGGRRFEITSTILLLEMYNTKTSVVPFTSFENCWKHCERSHLKCA